MSSDHVDKVADPNKNHIHLGGMPQTMAAAATSGSGEVHLPIPQPGRTDANGADVILESPLRAGTSTTPPRQLKTPSPAAATAPGLTTTTAIDKTLASASNLANLLPTGTALAFQYLSPSFTNRGACLAANRYLTAALLYLCTLSCVFFSFTDSFLGGDSKVYYGVATAKGFLVFNYVAAVGDDDQRRRGEAFRDLRRLRIRWVDYVHAVFTAVVFLTVAFSSAAVQSCYFLDAGDDVKQLLSNLPLGAGFMSTMVFLVFPTTRKGIGYSGQFTNT